MTELTYTVPKSLEGRKAKSVIRGEMGVSSHMFGRLKFSGGLTVDGVTAYANTVLHPGQVIRLTFQDNPSYLPTPYPMPLTIPYEDEHLMVIDKPAPLPTQHSAKSENPALENALFSYFGCPEDFVFRPVNRLDKGTSGLMVAAKTAHCYQRMQRLLHGDTFFREYLAIGEGIMPGTGGIIDLPIGKAPSATIKREIIPIIFGGKEARTHYQVLGVKDGRSLIRLRLDTGRTHQIRVHLSALDCPILGDFLYGEESPEVPGRFCLHSFLIDFIHPLTEKRVLIESTPKNAGPWAAFEGTSLHP